MAGSVGVAVRKAVVDGLRTHLAGLADFNGSSAPERKTAVSYAYDFGAADAERVFTGRSRSDTPPAAMKAGRNFRNEDGVFDLVVLVTYVGGSAEQADERAFAIGAEVETWLADRKSNELGVTGLNTLLVQSWESTNLGNDRGYMTELTYRVGWTARLT